MIRLITIEYERPVKTSAMNSEFWKRKENNSLIQNKYFILIVYKNQYRLLMSKAFRIEVVEFDQRFAIEQ